MKTTIQTVPLLSIVLSLAVQSECWIKREVQLNAIHDASDLGGQTTHHLDLNDINFGINDKLYTAPAREKPIHKLRHRALRKSTKASKKQSKSGRSDYSGYSSVSYGYHHDHDSSEDEHEQHVHHQYVYERYSSSESSSKASKKSNKHAGFMDEDIIEDFEEMFGHIISDDFSMESASKSSKGKGQGKGKGSKKGKSSKSKSSKLKSSALKKSKGAKSERAKRPRSESSKKSIPKLTMPPQEMFSSDDMSSQVPGDMGTQPPQIPPTDPPVQEPVTTAPVQVDMPTDAPAISPTQPPVEQPVATPPPAVMTPPPVVMTPPPVMTVPPVESTPPPVATMPPAETPTEPPVLPPTEAPVEMTSPPVETPGPTTNLNVEIEVSPWGLEYALETDDEPTPEDIAELEAATTEFLRMYMSNGFAQSPVEFVDFTTDEDGSVSTPGSTFFVGYQSTGVFLQSGVVPNPAQLDVILQQAFAGESGVQYLMVLQSLSLMNPFGSTTAVTFTRDRPEGASTPSSPSSSGPASSSSESESTRSSGGSAIPGITAGAVSLALLFGGAMLLKRRRDKKIQENEERSQKSRPTDIMTHAEETVTSDSGSLIRLWRHDEDEEAAGLTQTYSNDDASLYTTSRNQSKYERNNNIDVETVGSLGSNFSFRTPEEMAYTARSFGIELTPTESQSDEDGDEESNASDSVRQETLPERRCDKSKSRPWQKRSLNFSRYRNRETSSPASDRNSQTDEEEKESLPLLEEESMSDHLAAYSDSSNDSNSDDASSDSEDDKSTERRFGRSQVPVDQTDGRLWVDEETSQTSSEAFGSTETGEESDDSGTQSSTTPVRELLALHSKLEKDETASQVVESQRRLAEKRLASEHSRQAAQEAIKKAEETRLEEETRLSLERKALEARIKREEELRLQEERRLAEARAEFERQVEEEKIARIAEERRLTFEKNRADEALRKAEEEAREAEARRVEEEQRIAEAKAALQASQKEGENLLLRKEEELYLMKLRAEEEARDIRRQQEEELSRQKRELEERIRLQEEARTSEKQKLEAARAALEERLSQELYARLEAEKRLADAESQVATSKDHTEVKNLATQAEAVASEEGTQTEQNVDQARAQKRVLEQLLHPREEGLAGETKAASEGIAPEEAELISDNESLHGDEKKSPPDTSMSKDPRTEKVDFSLDAGEDDIEFSMRSEGSTTARKSEANSDEEGEGGRPSSDKVAPLDSGRPWMKTSKVKREQGIGKNVAAATFIAPWGDQSQSGHSSRSNYGMDPSRRGNRRRRDRSYRGSTRRLDTSQRNSRRTGRTSEFDPDVSNPNDRSMSTKEMSYRKYRTRNFGSDQEDAPWWLPDEEDAYQQEESNTLRSRSSVSNRRSRRYDRGDSSEEDSSTYAASISSTSGSSGYINSILPR